MIKVSPVVTGGNIRHDRRWVVGAGFVAALVLGGQAAAASDDSSFRSQLLPASLVAGTHVSVSLTFVNTGTTAWSPHGGYVLGCPDPGKSATWEVSMVSLPTTVEAGSSATFTFNVTAPDTPGTYKFQMQMVHGTTFFGATSTEVSIRVENRPQPL